jgi:hypothetical protein
MNVSTDQLKIITEEVERGNVVTATLKDDLIDHLCCEIEERLDAGKSFEESLKEALAELAPEGLDEIQQQTDFLLNTKKIYMKKLIYSIGLLSTMSCSLGFFFKILHWPGADQLFLFGFLGFGLLFLPLTSVNYIKTSLNKGMTEMLKFIFGTLSGFTAGLGTLLKILHLPGADQLLVIGGIMFSLLYLPVLFFDMYIKSSANQQRSNTGSIS